jgi:hypothetical protein
MARKPTDFVQVKIRMREALRRKLERSALLRDHSTNAEALGRIERTFAQDEEIAAAAEKMEAREAELREMFQQQAEEQAKREAKYAMALRDSMLLTGMLGKPANVELMREIMWLIHKHPEWPAPDKKKALADEIHSLITQGGAWEFIE